MPAQWAAVIAEPIVANNACIMPEPGYWSCFARNAARRQIVLIFDEIVTGFRLAAGGAQEHFGVQPDIAVFSKALGGGFPISAFAGMRNVMEPIGAEHGQARRHVQRQLSVRGRCPRGACADCPPRGARPCAPLRRAGDGSDSAGRSRSRDTLLRARRSVRCFRWCSPTRAGRRSNYRDLLAADARRYPQFRDRLLCRGLHVNASSAACWFLCTRTRRRRHRIWPAKQSTRRLAELK